jgi:hypothetical protein
MKSNKLSTDNIFLIVIIATVLLIIVSILIGSSVNITEGFEDSYIVPTPMTRTDNKVSNIKNSERKSQIGEPTITSPPTTEQEEPVMTSPTTTEPEEQQPTDAMLDSSIKEALKNTTPVINTQENMKSNNNDNEKIEKVETETETETVNSNNLLENELTNEEKELFEQITKNMLSSTELDKLIQAGVLTDKLIEKFLKQIDNQFKKDKDDVEGFCADKNCYSEIN